MPRIGQAVNPARERNRMLAVCDTAVLAHQHPGMNAAGATDNAGNCPVVRAGADDELARPLGIDANDHPGLNCQISAVYVELFRQIRAARDLQHLGRSFADAAINEHGGLSVEPAYYQPTRSETVVAQQQHGGQATAVSEPNETSCSR